MSGPRSPSPNASRRTPRCSGSSISLRRRRWRRTLGKIKRSKAKRQAAGGPSTSSSTWPSTRRPHLRARPRPRCRTRRQLRLPGPVSDVAPVGAFQAAARRDRRHRPAYRARSRLGGLEGDLNPSIDFAATTRALQHRRDRSPDRPGERSADHAVIGSGNAAGRSARAIPVRPFDQRSVALADRAARHRRGAARRRPGRTVSSARSGSRPASISCPSTDQKGNAALQAGRYVGENVYFGVIAGADGQTKRHRQSRRDPEPQGAGRGRHGGHGKAASLRVIR